MLTVTYLGAFFAGLLSFLSPCVLPLIPPYLCFLVGKSLNDLTDEVEQSAAQTRILLWRALAFVAGFTTVFVILGASATLLGQLLQEYLDVLTKIAGVIIIVMGVHFLGIVKIPFLSMEKRYHGNDKPAGFFGSYVIGLAFAFGWTPCVGPVLSPILGLAATEQSVYSGMSLLLVYSLGLGVPFILSALFLKPFLNFSQKFRKHLGVVEKLMGVLLILAGLAFLTGFMTTLSYWLLETFPSLSALG